ncbi:di-trans,poly-cis-decaprenylcistransferase [Candidatus Daviesbacteria bacterium RIFCSPHIGHO2_01_FULL_44_29]|uniref:Isoprenyl transferase n=1 Tax=Candidatus Daviesbacteria bacterium RIFCSPHIGHO2_02_FULL_43_12 TaxID=1797776 RepID=A0A1F5KK68_9BACT|nr:MAG: di-trans,poly-cis-decaprenylcistransferase [Candidatus Daviesbacteria bacterium RIFCSPHIGHO2_01_FULL_44_29]OGE39539.1 MAG: di-trans,poly-cis-decaprenylcistransferase [Candidatus Daviesbacteria bacterium RIFCSPHIGHO2_12_FULL_47_45]OGE41185.1 MAG: di-trans,poly-cis-decaprenylcistransferase [Candidatus Daviesbacteria bacterium RIFCSPHIGHO2_02_FULL_43_12]OGE69384.1 MAG: di-trans,poly-cis-decaprenylcistransferase [Candidatus Daviesbacteria bacterium RIFCSPLOWO2_01_FULL_43_15]
MPQDLQHVAIIPDGNRRWAKAKGLPSVVGHTKGYERTEGLVKVALKHHLKYLTFWVFSTENFNRSPEEIAYLMDIFRKLFKSSFLKKYIKKGVRVNVIGELDRFPKDLVENLHKLTEETKDNSTLILNVGLGYGGRSEILRAVNNIIKQGLESVDEATFSNNLYTAGQMDPDFIIRTSGEYRLSGFLPWQGVYSELYFTDKYFPDFDEAEFEKAIDEYYRRTRRFGK